jgi:hypothetical protein
VPLERRAASVKVLRKKIARRSFQGRTGLGFFGEDKIVVLRFFN